jgi:hypothetical protein
MVGESLGVDLDDFLQAVKYALLLGTSVALVDLQLGHLTGGEDDAQRKRQREEKNPTSRWENLN